MTERTLNDITDTLEKYQEQFEQAEADEYEVRSRKTGILNKINETQKEFDSAVQKIKDAAEKSSDWKRKRS